jgi:hypothetical protein
VSGRAEPDRHDQNHIAATVDGPAADLAQAANRQDVDEPAHNAIADDVPLGEHPTDDVGDVHRDDDAGTTNDDHEPVASEEPAHHGPTAEAPTAEAPTDDQPAAGPHAGEPVGGDETTDLTRSDGPGPLVAAIWAEDSAADYRDRWREAQLRFVDDPRQAAQDTRNLVNEAVDALTAALASHREQLNSLPTNGDTEQYRVVVQRYRTFYERLLTL